MKAKNTLYCLALCIISFTICSAQNGAVKESPVNKFMGFLDTDADSAFFYLKIISQKPYDLDYAEKFIHNQFSQAFESIPSSNNKKEKLTISFKLLALMEQSKDTFFQKNAFVINLWVNALQQRDNPVFIKSLITNQLNPLLNKEPLFKARLGRYALLIYQLAIAHKELTTTANTLLKTIYNKLEKEQPVIATDTASRKNLEKRGWHRYQYAYVNWIYANKETTNTKAIENYLEKAFNFSPDYFDRANADGYYYEMTSYFTKQKRSFADDYLNFLTSSNKSRETILNILLKLALKNPQYKEQLKAFYGNNEAFNNYWLTAANNSGSNAPALNLQLISGENFTTETYKNKWVIIDFWGTWCSPCRQEHPKLEKFYQSLLKKQNQDIILLTIACKDDINAVKNYMAEYKYNFPVAMADNSIEKQFKTDRYPTKHLISPQGKYITINNDVDLANFVEKFIY